ncbi:hypothetical protein Dsin_000352 [Dipteronia sinensis]|uniref:Uncharacterized protein n=1 Tax=Dipteronia sinensis TaxID=43782 RepID=A0AAE0EHG1_9ROSI|nr:hypothetical protein Dsin_000352 [Dipteronia sinensis]
MIIGYGSLHKRACQATCNGPETNKARGGLGVENVLITALEPICCLPAATANNSHQKCIEFFNSAAQFHNLLLKQAVKKLNTDTDNNSASRFIILNIHKSFMSALNQKHFKVKGQRGHYDSIKLFVFGDSYVDTENLGKCFPSWKETVFRETVRTVLRWSCLDRLHSFVFWYKISFTFREEKYYKKIRTRIRDELCIWSDRCLQNIGGSTKHDDPD